MPDSSGAAFRDRFAALDARLSAPDATRELDALKGEIGRLFKQVEQELSDLTTLRDAVKGLVERWKSLHGETGNGSSGGDTLGASTAPSIAPQFAAERPVSRADHLGASTFIEKGWSKLSLGDHPGAETALRKALDLSPNDPNAEALLGWALMLQEKYDEALMTFQKVLMRQPQNSVARINVGYICLKKGIFGEAIEHLSRAIRLDNDRKATLYAHFYLGLVYLERDMFEDAQTFFQKTLALGPNLIEAHFELGRAFWFNGQRHEALESWKRGRTANSFSPWGKRCGEMLRIVEAGGEP